LREVYASGEDVKAQRQTVLQTKQDVEKAAADITARNARLTAQFEPLQTRMMQAERSLRTVKETTGDLRATRDAAGLGQRIASGPQLRRIAQNYQQAKREVRARYLPTDIDTDPPNAFAPEVVFDAAMTYMTLASADRDDQALRLDEREASAVSGALLYVLKNLPSSRNNADPGQESWASERQLREAWRWLEDSLQGRLHADVRQRLGELIGNARLGAPVQQNAALIDTSLSWGRKPAERPNPDALVILRAAMQEKPRTILSRSSAVALAQSGDNSGWRELTADLERETSSYDAAALLAEEGPDALVQLSRMNAPAVPPETLRKKISAVLARWSKDAPSCFERRYARWLNVCLNQKCQGPSATAELERPCDPADTATH
jgi:hypothetical protein